MKWLDKMINNGQTVDCANYIDLISFDILFFTRLLLQMSEIYIRDTPRYVNWRLNVLSRFQTLTQRTPLIQRWNNWILVNCNSQRPRRNLYNVTHHLALLQGQLFARPYLHLKQWIRRTLCFNTNEFAVRVTWPRSRVLVDNLNDLQSRTRSKNISMVCNQSDVARSSTSRWLCLMVCTVLALQMAGRDLVICCVSVCSTFSHLWGW